MTFANSVCALQIIALPLHLLINPIKPTNLNSNFKHSTTLNVKHYTLNII